MLDHLRREGPLTRAQLRDRTTLSGQALADILHGLEQKDLVSSSDAAQPPGAPRRRGRPELTYTHNATRLSAVAVFVGLRYTEITVCDASGRPLVPNIQIMPGWEPDAIISAVSDEIVALDTREVIDISKLVLAFVIHGRVEADNLITNHDMGWEQVDLHTDLGARFDCPVTVREASRAAAMAEYIDGEHRGCGRLAVLNIGPIVTATLLTDGQIDAGFEELGGTIDQCYIPTLHGARRIDDAYGHLAIRRSYEQRSGQSVRWARDVSELAAGGDSDAMQVQKEIAEGIAYTVCWLVAVMSPERFVITGAVGDFPTDVDTLAEIDSKLDPRFAAERRVTRSLLGRQAWLRGGVHAALDAELRNRVLS